MADANQIEESVAVVGELVSLRLEADELFVGNVDVTFSVLTLDGPPRDANRRASLQTIFKRTFPAAPSSASGPGGRKVSVLSWAVELPQPSLASRLCLIAFEAAGTGESGKRLKARSLNRLRVPGIAITDQPELHAIMLHEFHKSQNGTFLLDTDALEKRLAGLSVEQRKLLATYDVGQLDGRLVIFVTFEPGTDEPMFADNCGGVAASVHANASFTVFACRGQGELVTLVCHTRNFVVNTNNPDTQRLFRGRQGAKSPDQWLSPSNPNPPKFKCASHVADFTDGVVWSRLFTASGVDVMPGNSIHGIINTIGCWMLFRNFNWPLRARDQLFRAFSANRTGGDFRSLLLTAGYDAPSSEAKFFNFDKNYAYNFFFRHVVGIQFFAAQSQFYGRFANLHNTHGQVFENAIDPADILSDRFLYHDTVTRKADGDPGFTVDDSLFITNALGFRTADGFLSAALWKQNLSPSLLARRTWSDWYFFKSPTHPLRVALQSPVGPMP